MGKSLDVEIEAFVERGAERFLERFVSVEWVALSSDAEPDAQPRHRAPTRELLIEQLVADNEGDREYVESKLIHGDLFLRERLTVSVWSNDESEQPTLSWVTDSDDDVASERDDARAELANMRADIAALTERMETEIQAAAAAVRARAIAECVAAALTHTTAPALALSEPGADPTQIALARVVHRAVTAVVDTLRALAAQHPAPTEPADVDPAAGALR